MWTSISLDFKIYLLVILMGCLAGMLYFRHSGKALKCIIFLLVTTLVSERVSRILAYKIHNSNPPYHFLSVAECLFLMGTLYYLSENKRIKLAIVSTYLGLAVFSLVNSFFIQTLFQFNSNIEIAKVPLTIAVTILVVFEKLNIKSDGRSMNNDELLILVAILWYHISSFVFTATHNYVISHKIKLPWIDHLNFYSNVIYYLLFCIAIILHAKTNKALVTVKY
jgi:hypothetical protein